MGELWDKGYTGVAGHGTHADSLLMNLRNWRSLTVLMPGTRAPRGLPGGMYLQRFLWHLKQDFIKGTITIFPQQLLIRKWMPLHAPHRTKRICTKPVYHWLKLERACAVDEQDPSPALQRSHLSPKSSVFLSWSSALSWSLLFSRGCLSNSIS